LWFEKISEEMMAMKREWYRPAKDMGAKLETVEAVPGSEIYRYDRNGKPVAMVFGGKRSAPDWWFNFPTEERREEKIAEWIANQVSRAASTKARRKARYEPHGFKVGDTFYASWGYDQTNVDFYRIVELKGKTMAKVVPVCGKTISSNPPREMIVAGSTVREWDVLLGVNKQDEDKGKWKRLTKDGFSLGHTHASPDDGSPHYETSSGWGH